MSNLSASLITFNAKPHITQCLASLKGWVDDIVIVDNGSTDGTIEIAKQYTDKVYVTDDWPGFGIQKQRAVDYCDSAWILSIDSDEVISPELKAEILSAIQKPKAKAFRIPRLNYFLSRPVRYGGCQKDAPVRLFHKEAGRFSNDLVHEQLIIKGNIGSLKHKMHHYTVDKIEDALYKMNQYSSLNAEQVFKKGKRCTIGMAMLRGWWTFLKLYIFQRGFLDGAAGFAYCRLKSQGCYYKYLKLWALS